MNPQKFSMDSNRVVLFYFFIVFASSTINCVLGLYEPVYYTEITDDYFAFQEVNYNALDNHYVVKTLYKDKKIFLACPLESVSDPSALEIRKRELGEAAVAPLCKIPPRPRIYLSKNPEVDHAVGFSIEFDYLPRGRHDSYEVTLPPSKYNAVIGLIYFKFDQIYRRIAVLRYNIIGGKLLKPEEDHNIEGYENNKEIFGYDIDPLYHKSECPFVKAPLAPSQDFLFDSWKIAARQNVFTAPMLPNVHSQWKALEIFIRKVSKVIDVVSVTTGLFGHLLKLPASYESENSSLKYFYLQNVKLRAPEYVWKTVTLEFTFQSRKYKYGILFILHQARNSDLKNTDSGVRKFCPEYDIVKLGWTFSRYENYYAPMYGCPLDNNIMELFGEQVEGKFEDFNLNSLSLLKLDDESNLYVKDVNVVEEMEKL